MLTRLLLPALLLPALLLPARAWATPYWTETDAAAARAVRLPAGERPDARPPAGTRASSYDDAFARAVWFIASMQVSDPLDPEYGGIREGETLLHIIQTDNTSESIWMFSHYFDRTGDASILPHLDASWTYVLGHPAYSEEGSSLPANGYYRYYNCGWALRAGMEFTRVFADTTHKAYVDSCANYLSANTLSVTGSGNMHDRVNPAVLSWGAGNLRAYGVAASDSLWMANGWKRGRRAKNWVDADPGILGREEWAMSGGAVMWGLLESYFDEYPAEEAAWVASNAGFMDTFADPGSWENAWQGWYAFGWKRLEESTGDPAHGMNHRSLTDYLLAFDATDLDGGIQGQPSDPDSSDQAWVTAYLGFMGLKPLLTGATAVPPPGTNASGPVLLLPARPNPFRGSTAIPVHLSAPSVAVVDILTVSGRRVARLVNGTLPAGVTTVHWDGRDPSGRSAASGLYLVRIEAGGTREARTVLRVR